MTNAPAPVSDPLTWAQVAADCADLGGGAFLASVQADGRPHVVWVSLGYGDEGRLWLATFGHSQKAQNLRHSPAVALHWPERPDRLAFARATARPVDDRAESDRLWDAGVVPYDPADFFGTRDNPDLLFVELALTRVTFRSLFDPTGPPRVWTPS
jgi:general stress protein 26